MNGTSSSGKTSTAMSFQEARSGAGECGRHRDRRLPRRSSRGGRIEVERVGRLAGPRTAYGLEREGDRGPNFHIGEQARRATARIPTIGTKIAGAGINVLVDEVSLRGGRMGDWCVALDGLAAVLVRGALRRRNRAQIESGERRSWLGLIRGQADSVHRFPVLRSGAGHHCPLRAGSRAAVARLPRTYAGSILDSMRRSGISQISETKIYSAAPTTWLTNASGIAIRVEHGRHLSL